MIDLERKPTSRECEYLRKRGRRDAIKHMNSDASEFRSPVADEAHEVFESACKDVQINYAARLMKCGDAHDIATEKLQFALESLSDLNQRALPAGSTNNADYHDEYRNMLKREEYESSSEQAEGKAQAAESGADDSRISAQRQIAFYKKRVLLWFRPYCEGVYSVNPPLVEQLQPFDVANTFGEDDPFDFIDDIAQKYPDLFNSSVTTKRLEAARNASGNNQAPAGKQNRFDDDSDAIWFEIDTDTKE